MLTGDLKIAEVKWVVQYNIKDAKNYLFNVKNVEKVKKGDVVRKITGVDKNQIGIVLKYEVNFIHNEIVTIMTCNGIIKNWYAKLIKRI